MAAFLVKNLPAELHERLRREAAHHHRSMNREVIAILEKELGGAGPMALPPPVRGKRPVDPAWVVKVIREARDGRP